MRVPGSMVPPFCVSACERFEQRRFPDAVWSLEEQLLIFLHGNVDLFRRWFVVLYDGYRRELEDLAADLVLAEDSEIPDGLIFLPDFDDIAFELLDLLVHFAGDVAEMAAFLAEEICLFLAVLDVALQAYVFMRSRSSRALISSTTAK